MWNRSFRILWVKIHVTEHGHFYMNLPISLYAFQELAECAMDLLAIACFFVPGNASRSSSLSVHTIREVLQAVLKMFDDLTFDEAYDLVEVETQNVKVSVKIR